MSWHPVSSVRDARTSCVYPSPGVQSLFNPARLTYLVQTMYTIKDAARLSGVPQGTLRAWERRYGVVTPHRNEAGYRIYDPKSVAAVLAMRRLIDAGWATSSAARAVREGAVPTSEPNVYDEVASRTRADRRADAVASMKQFLIAAARMDQAGLEESLDRGFTLGSFERVVESWLFPSLVALGTGWARGEIDVAGEHMATHAVHRRLAAAYAAAGSRSRGPSVVVGLPPGSQHELGALAFATAIKRRGLNVLYLGANVPETSWSTAVASCAARAAVIVVVTAEDRRSAVTTAQRLSATNAQLLVCCGGAFGADLIPGAHTLDRTIGKAAPELDSLLHAESREGPGRQP